MRVCDKADANVSAVKYHFGGKRENSTMPPSTTHFCGLTRPIPSCRWTPPGIFHADKSPERRLYLFIRTLLEHMFRDGRPSELTQLMSHEMMHPTAAARPAGRSLGKKGSRPA
ncbi:MAG: CerR family C-terminal domain-containing protein [Phycisphaerales bacterium]